MSQLSLVVEENERYQLLTFDTRTLWDSHVGIFSLSCQFMRIQKNMEDIRKSHSDVQQRWRDALNLLKKKIELFPSIAAGEITDETSHSVLPAGGGASATSSLEDQFFELLTRGVTSPGLEQFLQNTMPEGSPFLLTADDVFHLRQTLSLFCS